MYSLLTREYLDMRLKQIDMRIEQMELKLTIRTSVMIIALDGFLRYFG